MVGDFIGYDPFPAPVTSANSPDSGPVSVLPLTAPAVGCLEGDLGS
jgi:hypothetical protein